MYVPSPIVVAAESAISSYRAEARELEGERTRIEALRDAITKTTHAEVMLRAVDGRGVLDDVRRYHTENRIMLALDGSDPGKRKEDLPGGARASAIAGPPLRALLMMWVAEQEHALAKRQAAFDARDIRAEIAAAIAAVGGA